MELKGNNQGGFLLPEMAYIDKPRNGWMSFVIRMIGRKIIELGCWIKSLGYSQQTIYPRKAILDVMKSMKNGNGQ